MYVFLGREVDCTEFLFHRLLRLDHDVLTYLLEAIRSESSGGLTKLSETCKELRALSKPIMFRLVVRTVADPIEHRQWFLPMSLWSYIRCDAFLASLDSSTLRLLSGLLGSLSLSTHARIHKPEHLH